MIWERALSAGAFAVAESEVWAKGGAGGKVLAETVMKAARAPKEFRFLYPLKAPIEDKIRTIPGLPSHPAGERVDIDEQSNVVGLF